MNYWANSIPETWYSSELWSKAAWPWQTSNRSTGHCQIPQQRCPACQRSQLSWGYTSPTHCAENNLADLATENEILNHVHILTARYNTTYQCPAARARWKGESPSTRDTTHRVLCGAPSCCCGPPGNRCRLPGTKSTKLRPELKTRQRRPVPCKVPSRHRMRELNSHCLTIAYPCCCRSSSQLLHHPLGNDGCTDQNKQSLR